MTIFMISKLIMFKANTAGVDRVALSPARSLRSCLDILVKAGVLNSTTLKYHPGTLFKDKEHIFV